MDARVVPRPVDRSPRAGLIAPDLDDLHDIDGARQGQGLADRQRRLVGRARDVKVAVAVDDWRGQRLRRGYGHRHASAASSSRASSSVTTLGSSLVNTGVGASMGVPATMGDDAQVAAGW